MQTESMRRRICWSWTHLRVSGLLYPLLRPGQECEMWGGGLCAGGAAGRQSSLVGDGLQPRQRLSQALSGFQQDFCFCRSDPAFAD